MGKTAACGGANQEDVHTEIRAAGLQENPASRDYRRAMYAVTSSVTATSLNSGFVHFMTSFLRLVVTRHRTPRHAVHHNVLILQKRAE